MLKSVITFSRTNIKNIKIAVIFFIFLLYQWQENLIEFDTKNRAKLIKIEEPDIEDIANKEEVEEELLKLKMLS